MALTGQQIKLIRQALLDGFPDKDELEMMLHVQMEVRLDAVAEADNQTLRVYKLINWAERTGQVRALIDAAIAENPGNPTVKELAFASQTWQLEGEADIRPSEPLKIELDWVTVRAGDFIMGDGNEDCGGRKDSIYVPSFKIARVPVTNAQYEKFIDATGYVTPEYWQHGRIPQGKEEHPVIRVSWNDAAAYCKWAGVYLPSEAQWEKAARGTDGRRYPWGNKAPTKDLCNLDGNAGNTAPVGSYPKGASPYGVLDMVGNVWEWTSSLYKPYPYDASDGREDAGSTGRRTLRGSPWYLIVHGVHCAYRSYDNSGLRHDYVGFRVVTPRNGVSELTSK